MPRSPRPTPQRFVTADQIREQLERTSVFSGLPELCERMSEPARILRHADGATLIEQGGEENSLFVILAGAYQIQVNGHVVGRREAGEVLGEMSMVDPAATRSATVVASGPAIAIEVKEDEFKAMAQRAPQLWKALAVIIAKRLRNREQQLLPPRAEPTVFIASSAERASYANEFAQELRKRSRGVAIAPMPWTKDVHPPMEQYLVSVLRALSTSDIAVVILSADDLVTKRGRRREAPRDNLVLELGLALGTLGGEPEGRRRTFALVPEGLELPSDLEGLTTNRYNDTNPSERRVGFRAAAGLVLQRIKHLGARRTIAPVAMGAQDLAPGPRARRLGRARSAVGPRGPRR